MDVLRLATDAMGTRFELVLAGADPDRLRPAGEAALDEIADWHERLSRFDAGSFLTHVNTHAAARAVPLDDDLLELLAEADAVRRASGGAFDVGVGPLMQAWGFHGGPVRGGDETARAGGDAVVVDRGDRTVRFTRPDVALDLGGIGKGHALDHAAEVLREAGVRTALLHGGTSTALALGAPPGSDGWRIRLAGVSRAVTLRDAALSVSAPHGRIVETDGRTLGHVVDPRSGRPSERATVAAVVGPSARTADAWSTALLILGGRPPAMPAAYASLVLDAGGVVTVGGSTEDVFELDAASAAHEEAMA